MRKITFLFSVILSLSLSAQKQAVAFQIRQTHPYCGGARPTPEIEAAAREPQPYAGQKIFVISDKGKKDSLVTDQEGNFKMDLKPGVYKVYEPWKFHKRTPNGEPLSSFNKDCLKKEWAKEDIKITVSSKGKPEIVDHLAQGKCPWQYNCLVKKTLPE